MDPGLNQLLKWSVENSSAAGGSSATAPAEPSISPEAINALLGGPSDAELMVSSMATIRSNDPAITPKDKLVAFDNFEQLIENLDNANNLGPTELWPPLLECLGHEEGELRRMAAWCVGTAVQNNAKSQTLLVAHGGVEKLVDLAMEKREVAAVRRKAVYALSSACRNYQPAMDILIAELKKRGRSADKIDAADMDACDTLIGFLREEATEGR